MKDRLAEFYNRNEPQRNDKCPLVQHQPDLGAPSFEVTPVDASDTVDPTL